MDENDNFVIQRWYDISESGNNLFFRYIPAYFLELNTYTIPFYFRYASIIES